MSRRCIGYEHQGPGKPRKPKWDDSEGPASASASSALAMHERMRTPGLELGVPSGGAGPIERRMLRDHQDSERNAARQARLSREGAAGQVYTPTNAERMAASRNRGARRHVEVISKPRPSPAPLEEVAPVSEERADHSATIPVPDPDEPVAPTLDEHLEALGEQSRRAREAWLERIAALVAFESADEIWTAARVDLVSAWGNLGLGTPIKLRMSPALVDAITSGEAQIAAGQSSTLDEVRRSIAAIDEVEAAVVEPGDPDAGLPTADDVLGILKEPTPAEEAHELSRLTSYQRRALEAVTRHRGDRKAAAVDLGTKHFQSIDSALESIGSKGLLPAELIPLLPARFARYASVPG